MTARERVLAALRREEPDRVPYCELGIDRALAQRLMGWGEPTSQAANQEANPYSVEEAKAIASRLQMDNISYILFAPVYVQKHPGQDGRLFYLNILGLGTPEEVDQEVRELIHDVGPGGGYIVTSGNSLAGYLRLENVLALSRAVQEYGHYPLGSV